MPYREPSYKNYYYHVYNRGNNFEKVFFENRNYQFFLERLVEIFGVNIDLTAYVLMPNHFHLIVKVNKNDALRICMQRFSTSYTKAINVSQNRVGHLFQGKYKVKLIPEDNYLLHLSRYIHLNPVRACLVSKPEDWEYSSYQEYIGKRHSEFIKNDIIMNQCNNYVGFVIGYQEDQSHFVNPLLFK